MVFTGMRVLFGDHRQFERIGITPDGEVKPTIEGLRNGVDKVLEKAAQVLKENSASQGN